MAQENRLPNTLIFRFAEQTSENSTNKVQEINLLQALESSYQGSLSCMAGAQQSLKSSSNHPLQNMYMYTLSSAEEYAQCFRDLSQNDAIKYVTPYYIPQLLADIDDPKRYSQYHISLLDVYDAFDICTGDTNIVIGIVDTGLDMTHEDLVDNIKINYNDPVNGIDDDLDGYVDNFKGWDMANDDSNPQYPEGYPHGVYVSGIAGASTNNGLGIASPGYQCKILPIKIANSAGSLTMPYQGVVYAADHGCKIINCSWGDSIPNPALKDVIDYAVNDRGCIVVAAAGNASDDNPYYPAAFENVVSVAATNQYDIKWSGSSFGKTVDLSAPGQNVFTTFPNDKYSSSYVSGTSYASPMVASVAALVWSNEPDFTNKQVIERLRISADVIDTIYENEYYERRLGYGRVNAYNALANDSSASIRITDLNIQSKLSEHYPAGDTLDLIVTLENFLAPASSCLITLEDNSSYTTITSDFYNAGSLGTLESKTNTAFPFRIILSDETPPDHTVTLSFEMEIDGIADYQEFQYDFNQSYIDLDGNEVLTSFTSNGNIGYSNASGRKGNGFVFNNVYNLLSNGGLIVGTNKFALVSSMELDEGFDIVSIIDTTVRANDIYGVTEFTPSQDKWEVNLNIKQESRLPLSDSFPTTVFHTYTLRNDEDIAISDLRMGLFTDWDLWYSQANIAKYHTDLNMVYTYSYGNYIMYAGVVLLSDESSTPYCFHIISGGDDGIDISDDFSDDEKWDALSTVREKAGYTNYASDVATMLSCGPYELEAGDSIKVHYAIIGANNFNELEEKAWAAQKSYIETKIAEENSTDILLYPNPAQDKLYIKAAEKPDRITLVDMQGRLLGQFELEGNSISVDKLPNGLYVARIKTGKDTYIKTFNIMR